MSLWRLEVLRLTRSGRGLALVAVYVVFGLLGPITARYIDELVSLAGGDLEGATIEFPDPVPADGIAQYVSNANQIGILVAVGVAAGALAFDAVPEMAVFLRTRVGSMWRLLLPRFVVAFLATAGAYMLGAVAAWYETWALIGSLDALDMLAGIGLGVIFLAFVVALVGAVAQWTRTVIATVATCLVILVAMPVVGVVDVVGRWSPSRLASGLAVMAAGGDLADFTGPVMVSVLATAGLCRAAVAGAKRREL